MAMDAFDRATAVVGQNVDAKAINHFIDVQDGHAVVYAYPKYYRNGGGILEPSRERFVPGKSGFVFEAVEGVHRARVASNGTIRMEHLDGTIDQKIVGIAAVNPVGLPTKIWQIDLAAWARTMTENRIVWTHPDGYVYEVVYCVDALVTRLTIPPSAFARLRAFLPPGAVAFGPILDWDERGLGTDWSCSGGEICDSAESIKYSKGGRVVQSVRAARIGGKAFDLLSSWQKRRLWNRNARFLVESVPCVALEGQTALVFNDSMTYQHGVLPDVGYSGCIDNTMDFYNANTNWGTATYLAVGGTANTYRGLLGFDFTLPGVTVTDAWLDLYSYIHSGAGQTHSFFRVLKPWEETDSSWNQWDNSGAKEWGTAGCNNTDDAGVENTGDGTGADRKATPVLAYATINGTGWDTNIGKGNATFKALVQAWIDGTATDTHGLCIIRTVGAANTYHYYYSRDYAVDASLRPKLAITYSTGGPRRRRLIAA